MTQSLRIPNGIPLYLLGTLLNDFNPIFCQACGNSIHFIGARNHLAVHLKIFDRLYMANMDWDHRYAFDSDEVKERIAWFRTKANSNTNSRLSIEPYENEIRISNSIVNTKLLSFVKRPAIPKIPEMDGGVLVQIADMKEMVGQVRSIGEEVVRLIVSDSELWMSGSTHNYTRYRVPTTQPQKSTKIEPERSTICFKEMLSISCRLASEVAPRSTELRFYPGGASQISATGSNVSMHCLLTAVKQ